MLNEMMPKSTSKEMGMDGRGGHLYMQINEVRNTIIYYHRSAKGALTEVERVVSGWAGSGTYLAGKNSTQGGDR